MPYPLSRATGGVVVAQRTHETGDQMPRCTDEVPTAAPVYTIRALQGPVCDADGNRFERAAPSIADPLTRDGKLEPLLYRRAT